MRAIARAWARAQTAGNSEGLDLSLADEVFAIFAGVTLFVSFTEWLTSTPKVIIVIITAVSATVLAAIVAINQTRLSRRAVAYVVSVAFGFGGVYWIMEVSAHDLFPQLNALRALPIGVIVWVLVRESSIFALNAVGKGATRRTAKDAQAKGKMWKRSLNTTQTADRLIVALVKHWEEAPAELLEPGFGADVWELAAAVSLISCEEANEQRTRYLSGAMDDLLAAQALMTERGWANTRDVGEFGRHSKALYPTPKGIDYARAKMRPWPMRAWEAVRNPTRKVVVAVISYLAVAVLTYVLAKYVLK